MDDHAAAREKHRKVMAWLESTFAPDPVPSFEMNDYTIGYLYYLASTCEERARQTEILQKDITLKTNEYQAEATRLAALLAALGLDEGALSTSGGACARSIASTAAEAGASDTSHTRMHLCLASLVRERVQLEADVAAAELTLVQCQQAARRSADGLLKLERTKSELELHYAAEATLEAQRRERTEFLAHKAAAYQHEAAVLEERLRASGFHKALSHTAIVEQAERMREKEVEIAPARQHLAACQQLPPDAALARVRVEEARQELGRLQAEVQRRAGLQRA